MSPPGLAPTTEPSAGYSRDRVTDLSTKEGRKRYLMQELGVTGCQAKRLLAAYAADLADADRLGNDTGRSDEAFLDWLMRQAPGGRKRSVCKREWRVAS